MRQWDTLTLEEIKEQLLQLLESPSFVEGIIYEPNLGYDGNPQRKKLVTSRESCKKIASLRDTDGFSCGSFYNEELALAAIKTVILAEVDTFAEWIASKKFNIALNGYSNQDVAFIYVNEGGKLNEYDTKKFYIRFSRDYRNISKCGFLVVSVVPVK